MTNILTIFSGFSVDLRLVAATFMMIGLDIFTGTVGAFAKGEYKSAKMREGGRHKLGLVTAIIFGLVVDFVLFMVSDTLGLMLPVTSMVCTYIIFMELMSCIENFDHAWPGVLPSKLVGAIRNAANEHKEG